MRVKVSLLVLAGLLIAAVAIPAGSTAAPKAGGKVKAKATCTGSYVNPTPTKLKGVDFGFVSCKGFFGKGVQTVNYTEGVAKSGVVTAGGPTKIYGNLGTMHGAFSISGTPVGTTVTLTGSGKITGGTGVYTGAKGTVAKIKCKTSNGGANYTCAFTVTLTKL